MSEEMKLTPEQALEALELLDSEPDTEFAHLEADRILLALLRYHNHNDVIAAFRRIAKWYS